MTMKTMTYWFATTILCVELLVGGTLDLAHNPKLVEVIRQIGYPEYVMTILGFWKIPGAVVLLAPRFLRLKEWAYAGIFFELTGGGASHLLSGDNPANAIVPLLFAVLTLVSWACRPQNRTLGVLLPTMKSHRAINHTSPSFN